MKTILYIDGFNLYYGALRGTPLRWLNPLALASREFRRNQIIAVRYFSAQVQGRPSDTDEPLRQELYWRALLTLPDTEIIQGHFRVRKVDAAVVVPPPRTIKVYKTEEKGSDVNLAAHLLMDGFRDRYECAIVMSGDSDLVTPVRMVKEQLGKPIGVFNPQRLSGPNCPPRRKNAGLLHAASFYREGITWKQLVAAQFPDTLTDAKGTFHKPPSWK
jgi:uncharacterized LabA/DUF88 family protein